MTTSPARAFHEELARLLARGERVAIATVVRARGSHPRHAGAKMLVRADGRSRYSVGGGALEASVVKDCLEVLAGAAAPGVRAYELAETGERSVGMTCGGTVEVFVEVEEPGARLYVFGAGHVGRALAQVASLLALPVTVVDDRSEWLDPAAFPEGAALHRCGPDYAADLPAVPSRALAAVMTRCHATDVNVMQALARSAPRYVGMIGSRRKVLRAFEALEERGVSRAWLDTVRAPIGLDIGADTPGEIAVAVGAEIVAALSGVATRPEAPRP